MINNYIKSVTDDLIKKRLFKYCRKYETAIVPEVTVLQILLDLPPEK